MYICTSFLLQNIIPKQWDAMPLSPTRGKLRLSKLNYTRLLHTLLVKQDHVIRRVSSHNRKSTTDIVNF